MRQGRAHLGRGRRGRVIGTRSLAPPAPRATRARSPGRPFRRKGRTGDPGPSGRRGSGAILGPRGEAKAARWGDARCGKGTGARWATPVQRSCGLLRARRERPTLRAAACTNDALRARGRRAGRARGAVGTRLRPSFAGSVGSPPAPRPNAAIFRAFPGRPRLPRRRHPSPGPLGSCSDPRGKIRNRNLAASPLSKMIKFKIEN